MHQETVFNSIEQVGLKILLQEKTTKIAIDKKKFVKAKHFRSSFNLTYFFTKNSKSEIFRQFDEFFHLKLKSEIFRQFERFLRQKIENLKSSFNLTDFFTKNSKSEIHELRVNLNVSLMNHFQ